MVEVLFKFENISANKVSIALRQSADKENETLVGYDFINELAYVDIFKSSNYPRGALSLPLSEAPVIVGEDGIVTLRIFLDRSIIETYINNEVAITKRIYPDLADALGIEISSDGYFILHELTIYQMNSVYEEINTAYEDN